MLCDKYTIINIYADGIQDLHADIQDIHVGIQDMRGHSRYPCARTAFGRPRYRVLLLLLLLLFLFLANYLEVFLIHSF